MYFYSALNMEPPINLWTAKLKYL